MDVWKIKSRFVFGNPGSDDVLASGSLYWTIISESTFQVPKMEESSPMVPNIPAVPKMEESEAGMDTIPYIFTQSPTPWKNSLAMPTRERVIGGGLWGGCSPKASYQSLRGHLGSKRAVRKSQGLGGLGEGNDARCWVGDVCNYAAVFLNLGIH